MGMYLCYDLAGIQSHIFKIPKLKHIIGGSAQIDKFDRQTVLDLNIDGVKRLYSGGGKGAFYCENEENIAQLKKDLLESAHQLGLDIRFGIAEEFLTASSSADELYPCLPDSLEGVPCAVSGMYPVKSNGEVHELVKKRLFERGTKMFRWYEESLLDGLEIGEAGEVQAEFFHNVEAEDGPEGRRGSYALGGRNRWAVICMDGNDIGSQLREKMEDSNLSQDQLVQWVGAMSSALDNVTRNAVRKAISVVVDLWSKSKDYPEELFENLILPIRPLIVGGDDVVVLCHSSYAFDFVEAVMEAFEKESQKAAEEYKNDSKKDSLWPATSGSLSISAGILFAPVSLPLNHAIDYAESLLANAKHRGREFAKTGQASPASLDWEFVTESMLDSPWARRQRDLEFIENGQNIRLTCRPYLIEKFKELRKLSDDLGEVPKSILSQVQSILSKPLPDRMAAAIRMAKHQPELAQAIWDSELAGEWPIGTNNKSRWFTGDGDVRNTDLLDAIMLKEESQRMLKETVEERANV